MRGGKVMRGIIASACQDTALLHLAGVHSDRKMALHSPSNSHQALQGPVPAMHFQAQASGAHHHNRDTVGKSFRRAYFRG